jgi:SRSO17 transposase
MYAVRAWDEDFAAVVGRIGPRFARAEARRHAADYLRGLLGGAARKNSWQLAEAAGDATPYGLQQFLYRAAWDPVRWKPVGLPKASAVA